tara:strand:+ start:396 stop:728 length:333 start_codon:yes stop_codon:yes gene_type:complete
MTLNSYDTEEIANLYEVYRCISPVAKELGCGTSTVTRHLRMAGIVVSRGRPKEYHIDAIVRAIAQGGTVAGASELLGCSESTIRRRITSEPGMSIKTVHQIVVRDLKEIH